MTDTLIIVPNPTATLVVAAGDGPTLVNNPGPNTVYLGDNEAIRATDASGIVPLTANGYINVDGNSNLYATIAAGQSQLLNLISGGLNFFSPPSLSGLGGAKVFVQATAPTGTIPLNSLWFNTTLNALEYWNGSSWVVQAFAGNEVIVANTIGVSQLVANLVYAGIVNGTIIQGATFKLVNSFGAIDGLWDSGTDAIYIYADTGSATQGGIQASLAAKSATDPTTGANVPQGLYSQQLTLANQAADPPAFTGASVFFSTVAGRPAYKSSAGARNIIERSDINVATFSIGNTTTPGTISSTLTYQANEGSQGSEYEIEVDAVVVTGSVTAAALTFQLFVDGVAFGSHITIGAVMLAINNTFYVTLRARITLTNPGSLVAQTAYDGGISKSANVGSESAFPVINASMQQIGTNNYTLDPTVTHTFQLFANWSATNTGESVTVNRTRITRRF